MCGTTQGGLIQINGNNFPSAGTASGRQTSCRGASVDDDGGKSPATTDGSWRWTSNSSQKLSTLSGYHSLAPHLIPIFPSPSFDWRHFFSKACSLSLWRLYTFGRGLVDDEFVVLEGRLSRSICSRAFFCFPIQKSRETLGFWFQRLRAAGWETMITRNRFSTRIGRRFFLF